MYRMLGLVVVLIAANPVARGQNPVDRLQPLLGAVGPATAVKTPKTKDADALRAAGLKEDEPAQLLAYLRQRTLSDTDTGRIRAVIRRFGGDDFDERVKATAEVERFGPAAVGLLSAAAQSDPDPEVSYRAGEALRRLEKVPHAAVSLAVTRALAKLDAPQTAAVLLGFLPFADDDGVAAEIRKTLVAKAVRNGKAEPALVEALTDPTPARRAAAGVALLEGGPADQRVRIPDAIGRVRAAVKAESDAETKFQIVYSLLTVVRDKEAVAPLIELLPDLPRGRLWQAEDYLLQLAGPNAPKAKLGKGRESLVLARDTWSGWWAAAAPGTDLGAFDYQPRITGKTLLVMMSLSGFGSSLGTVMELGPDMKQLWRIDGLNTTMDAQVLPDGYVAVAEMLGQRVTVRDTNGVEDRRRTVVGKAGVAGYPQQVQVLPNGNLLIAFQGCVIEVKKGTNEEVMRFNRSAHDVISARRLADGTTAVLCQNSPIVFLDAKGSEQESRKLNSGSAYYLGALWNSGPDRLLVTEMDQVVEYDLKSNKPVWTKKAQQPRSVQRLPNGNTLIVETSIAPGEKRGARIVEVSPDLEEVWSYQASGKLDDLTIARAYRR
jgi:hypothetical protein